MGSCLSDGSIQIHAIQDRHTANVAGIPVVAGPVEATAIGNVMVRLARSASPHQPLEAIGAIIADCTELRRYEPC